MAAEIEKVRQLIAEHATLRENFNLLGDQVNDLEALKVLESFRDSFSDTGEVVVSDKLQKLMQVMNFLHEDLHKHFEDEEQLLPGMLGAPLAQALKLEHQHIMEKIASLIEISDNKKLEEISQQWSPALIEHICRIIKTLHRMVEEHSTREEIILQMLLVGLQES